MNPSAAATLRVKDMAAIIEEGCDGFGLLYQDDPVSVRYVHINLTKRLGLAGLCRFRGGDGYPSGTE